MYRVNVLVASDSGAQGLRRDESGPLMAKRLELSLIHI